MATIVEGDLLKCDSEMIVHQGNCVTTFARGICQFIFAKYPYAEVYKKRPALSSDDEKLAKERNEPGTIEVREPGKNKTGPVVACLMAQIAPGKPGVWAREYKINRAEDTVEKRLSYFKNCLVKLIHVVESRKIKMVAFPYLIGCGLAGGEWNVYLEEINRFAQFLPGVTVLIYRKPTAFDAEK